MIVARAQSVTWFWRPRVETVSEVVSAGLVAGLTGGVLWLLAAMAHAALVGPGPLLALRLVGATLVGPVALVGGAGILAWGLFLHLALSVLLGWLFTALLPRPVTTAQAAFAAVTFAILVMVVNTSVVLPGVNPWLRDRMLLAPWGWLAAHVAYGLGLALTPAVRGDAYTRES